MNTAITRRTTLGAIAFAAALVTGHAVAQEYPAKPVTIVVPYVAGAGVDPVARQVGQKLSELWGKPVIVENKAGASGSIGAKFVVDAPADGHTILFSATPEVVINQFIMKKMNYNPETDLVPVTLAVKLPFLLVTHPSNPYNTLPELLAYAKANPGKVSYASSGNGTGQHLAAALMTNMAKVDMLHIPYKGVAQSLTDMLGNNVNIGFAGLPAALPHVQKGTLKALAISSKDASPAAPNIPPVASAPGLGNYEINQWFGVFVPKGTSSAIVDKIQADVAKVLAMPDVKASLEKQGAQPSGMSTEEFNHFVKAERQKFQSIVKESNITE